MSQFSSFLTSLFLNIFIGFLCLLFFLFFKNKIKWIYSPRLHVSKHRQNSINATPPSWDLSLFGWLSTALYSDDQQLLKVSGPDSVVFCRFFSVCFRLFFINSLIGLLILIPINYSASTSHYNHYKRYYSHSSSSSSSSSSTSPSSPNDNYQLLNTSFNTSSPSLIYDLPDSLLTSLDLSVSTSDRSLIDSLSLYMRKAVNLDGMSLGSLSMSNISDGSHILWIHCLACFLFTFIALYLFWVFWESYVVLRHSYLRSQQLRGECLTVLVSNIPDEYRQQPKLLSQFFKKLYPNSFLSASFVYDTIHLHPLVCRRLDILHHLEHAHAEFSTSNTRPTISTFLYCFNTVDAIEYYADELKNYNQLVSIALTHKYKPTHVAFITFKSSLTVQVVNKLEQNCQPRQFKVKLAPLPQDVYWPNLNLSESEKLSRDLVVYFFIFLLIAFWSVPLTIAASFSNVSQLANQVPSLFSWIVSLNPALRQIVESFLPSIIINFVMWILPFFLWHLTQWQGFEAKSWMQISVLRKYFLFVVINFFAVSLISGSIFNVLIPLLNTPDSIFDLLGYSIPATATFFLNYILFQTFTGFGMQLTRITDIFLNVIQQYLFIKTPEEQERIEIPHPWSYGYEYPQHLLIFLLAIAFSPISPIISPIACLYFGMGSIVNTHQHMYIYSAVVESGGIFWPIVFRRLIVGLVVAQITWIGFFGIKQCPMQSTLLLLLPLLTWMAYKYLEDTYGSKAEYLPVEDCIQIDEERKSLLSLSNNKSSKQYGSVDSSTDSESKPQEDSATQPPVLSTLSPYTRTLRSAYTASSLNLSSTGSPSTSSSSSHNSVHIDRVLHPPFIQPELLEPPELLPRLHRDHSYASLQSAHAAEPATPMENLERSIPVQNFNVQPYSESTTSQEKNSDEYKISIHAATQHDNTRLTSDFDRSD